MRRLIDPHFPIWYKENHTFVDRRVRTCCNFASAGGLKPIW